MAGFLILGFGIICHLASGRMLDLQQHGDLQGTTKVFGAPSFFQDFQSQRVTIKYPAVSVPPMNENDGMGGFEQPSTPLPCRDCLITSMQMGLEYVDGSPADANTGIWLHHGIMVNRNRTDSVCGRDAYGQRFFASGNERTLVDISASGAVKAGYYIGPSDVVALSVDLMNMLHSRSQEGVVLTITYEYIQGRRPKEFSSVTPYWLDDGSCRTSNLPAYRNTTFRFTSTPTMGFPKGQLTFVAGHLHDGGTHIDLVKNGQVLCSLDATYGGYRYLSAADSAMEHITRIATCELAGKTALDDKWSVVAHYDTTLHEPMSTMDGSLEPVMGIILLYVADDLPRDVPCESKWLNNVLGWVIGIAVACLVIAWVWLGRDGHADRLWSLRRRARWHLEGEAKAPLLES